MERFEDKYYSVFNFKDEILIECPKCGGRGHVVDGKKLTCFECGLRLTNTTDRPITYPWTSASWKNGKYHRYGNSLNRHWFGRFVSNYKYEAHRCKKCGGDLPKKHVYRSKEQKHPRLLEITCSHCKSHDRYEVEWVPCLDKAEARDPYFGAVLYLQTEVKDGYVYAYNAEHAQTCFNYFNAGLRERSAATRAIGGTAVGYKSMFTVMPSWLKSAKNRSIVVKAYSKLLERAVATD